MTFRNLHSFGYEENKRYKLFWLPKCLFYPWIQPQIQETAKIFFGIWQEMISAFKFFYEVKLLINLRGGISKIGSSKMQVAKEVNFRSRFIESCLMMYPVRTEQ